MQERSAPKNHRGFIRLGLNFFMDELFNQTADPLNKFWSRQRRNTRLIISLSVVGLVLFLSIAIIAPFKDRLFQTLYPKPKIRATSCTVGSLIPSARHGFIYTGGDLSQIIQSLQTPLYYTYDASLGPQKQIFLVGRYINNLADPLGLQILSGGSFVNSEFKGLWGQPPGGWNVLTSGRSGDATIETAEENTVAGGTSVKVSNQKSPSGTQVAQISKKAVSAKQYVVFGAWVKADNPGEVKILLQNSQAPYQEFGSLLSQPEAKSWTYVYGLGQVPEGVNNFQLVLRAGGMNTTAWFDEAAAAVIDGTASQALTDLVLERCGSAWFVDHEMGWEQGYSDRLMKSLSPEAYALIYYQFYNGIKGVDPAAVVMNGGLAGAPTDFESPTGYSPKNFLDAWRSAYKKFFNNEPSVDALNMHYLAAERSFWGAEDLAGYVEKLRSYIDQIPEWRGKPIWIGKLGVSYQAPKGGVDFMKSATDFLNTNNLNIAKWFWFDTCGYNSHLAPLFESNNKLCNWPMQLTALGQTYVSQMITPTPTSVPSPTPRPPTLTPTLTLTPTVTATPSATLAPTSTPTPAPTSTPVPTTLPTDTPVPTLTLTPTPSEDNLTVTPTQP